ncbi:MAG: c-type cytochrome [Myxococcota bacterium]
MSAVCEMRLPHFRVVLGVLAVVLSACDSLPGKPDPADRYVRPEAVLDFETLFAGNCRGCHGEGGKQGPAPLLADPLYLAYAGSRELRRIVSEGVPGTPMPAFLIEEGGTLRAAQIDALVDGMQKSWGMARRFDGLELPSYRGTPGSDADLPIARARGRASFRTFCANCHGAGGGGTEKAGSVFDPSFLALVSDQGLRTAVVVGRPDLGMPAYYTHAAGRPMRDEEIEDVVTWMAAHRVEFPGRPFAQAAPVVGKEP